MTQRVRKAIFPVAGLGTRLLPATKSIPKEMITIVDRPLIQYAVDALDRAGLCRGLGLVLSLRSRFLAGSKGEEDQGDRQDAHGERR